MRLKLADLSRIVPDDIIPFSKTISNRTTKRTKTPKLKTSSNAVDNNIPDPKVNQKTHPNDQPSADHPEYRENEMQIQMLSDSLFQQIFRQSGSKLEPNRAAALKDNLRQHGIKAGESFRMPDITKLRLPKLFGANIEEHFLHISRKQSDPYKELISGLVGVVAPEMPAKWQLKAGWTHYCADSQTMRSVPYPEDRAIVFDIENCVKEGSAPTMACALGQSGWYSWVSPSLVSCTSRGDRPYHLSDLIPLEDEHSAAADRSEPRIVVGHNVSYDRARIKEQYVLQDSGTRFMDTMSMHVCCSGVTSYQRAMLKSKREMSVEDQAWSQYSSLNSLLEVHRLYCPDAGPLDKDKRNTFVEGHLEDIRQDFQDLMRYCALDVLATHRVLRVLFPMFCDRFPHPATLAGMLEIGMAYLPVTSSWKRYIQAAHLSYDDLTIESNRILEQRANWACRLANEERWRNDIWMWDQDWSVQELKLKKATKKKSKPALQVQENAIDENDSEIGLFESLTNKFQPLIDKQMSLPARRPLLPGYPEWYRKLCDKNRGDGLWKHGPTNIGTGMQITPKLLSLCWEGYPLHYIKGKGWGFLLPFNGAAAARNGQMEQRTDEEQVPLQELFAKCPVLETGDGGATRDETDDAFQQLVEQVEMNLGKRDYYRRKTKSTTADDESPANAVGYTGTGVWTDEQIGDNVWFLKLPHKDGVKSRVGNPMAKDFLGKFAENVLSGEGRAAERVIRIAGQCSYWRNNRERIGGQMVVWLDDGQETGAIVPQVVVCGTLTRRAMESTWMTASNAQRERVGSELRGMITAPNGYRLVGADVDSQELWIAAVLGDAAETGCHGATPFGWMTLNGSKANGTDMHSVTAKAVGISRDQAKVINYARIYGAGQQFAERLLKQFNPTLSEGEARSKAMKMFVLTKGKRLFHLNAQFHGQFLDKGYTRYEASRLCAAVGQELRTVFERPKWFGGTESAMFNRLEEIAEMAQPTTPFLQCRLSRALEPQPDGGEDRFLPTRVNWVVQSGAVDFLHLMLVCMRWLMGADNIRFCLSFHDEIRYLVREDLADQAAVAMHVTNLLTRAFCAHRLGLNDLPQSVAFFQSVEIDRVLRKESRADYTTPSNPHGLEAGYGISAGESMTIEAALERIAGNEDMSKWPWHRTEVIDK